MGMIYPFKCKNCESYLELYQETQVPHVCDKPCVQCGGAMKRIFTVPQVVYKGRPDGFAAKEAERDRRYKDAMTLANRHYHQPTQNPISENDSFWEGSAEQFDSYKPTLYGAAGNLESKSSAPTVTTENATATATA